jgi:hypothetical protein
MSTSYIPAVEVPIMRDGVEISRACVRIGPMCPIDTFADNWLLMRSRLQNGAPLPCTGDVFMGEMEELISVAPIPVSDGAREIGEVIDWFFERNRETRELEELLECLDLRGTEYDATLRRDFKYRARQTVSERAHKL